MIVEEGGGVDRRSFSIHESRHYISLPTEMN